jgi:hypothetical protein
MKVARSPAVLAVILVSTGCEQPQAKPPQPDATFAMPYQPSIFDGYGLEEADLSRICSDDAVFLPKQSIDDENYLGNRVGVRAEAVKIPAYRTHRDSGPLTLYSNISVSSGAPAPILAISEEIDGVVDETPWRNEEGSGFSRIARDGSSWSIRNDKIRKILSAILFATNGPDFQAATLDEFARNSESNRYADTARMIGAPALVADWYIPQVRLNDNDAKLDLAGNVRVAVAQDRNDVVFVRLTGDDVSVLAIIDPSRMAGLHYVCGT